MDPYRNYNFKLEIGGITEGHFTACSGLNVDVEVIQYREAGNKQLVQHIPGKVNYAGVTLSYGLTDSTQLWAWMMKTVKGEVDRKNVSIILLDSAGSKEKMRWNMVNAWPSAWRGAPLDAMSHEISIESLTLVFDSLERS